MRTSRDRYIRAVTKNRGTRPLASTRVVMVRMNKELAQRFETLRAEFQGLPPASIIRMIVGATLALPLDAQIEIVNAQIRRPGSPPAPRGAGKNRLHLNSRRTPNPD